MQLTSTLYRNSIFVFAVFFTLVTWGFWSTYYSNPLEMVALGNSLTAVHLHGAGMTLWCVMLVSQAYLIRTNRRDLHRMIGRSSYVLAPVVIVLQWLVVRNVVLADPMMLGEQGTLTNFAAVFMSLVLGGSVLFTGLYALAIYFRRNTAIHARLMVATTIPILPPAMDRIVLTYFPGILDSLPAVHKSDALVAFAVADLFLIGLAVWDWRSRPRLRVFPLLLLVMLVYQTFTFNAHRVPLWSTFGEWFVSL